MTLTTSSPTPTLDEHKWENCDLVDEMSITNINPISEFMDELVVPWLKRLDAQEEQQELNLVSAGYTGHWSLHQTRELRQVSIQNFCLSIDGMFERELRQWMGSIFHVLESPYSSDDKRLNAIKVGNLSQLSSVLKMTRNITLEDFPAYPVLSLMKFVANVCRHGPGPSLETLKTNYHNFWLACTRDIEKIEVNQIVSSYPIFPSSILFEFQYAVRQFWLDVRYVFLKSGGGHHAPDARNKELSELREKRWAYAHQISEKLIFKRFR